MKGEQTRALILDAALRLVRLEGFEALSIGRLAQGVGLSKSGLFAHFNSKEALQLRVLERGIETFVREVIRPAIKEARGEPRLRALFERWLSWAAGQRQGGCIFLGGAVEFDDRPGAVRDFLVKSQKDWTHTLAKAAAMAQACGHLKQEASATQLAFDVYSIMMGYHFYRRLLGDPQAEALARGAFEQLLEANRHA